MKVTQKTSALIKRYFVERFQDLPLLIKPTGKEDRFTLYYVSGSRQKAIIATKPAVGSGIEVLCWEQL